MKQADRVLNYLQEHQSITAKEALDRLGIAQLPARIWQLRERGYVISTTPKWVKNRYGEKVKIGVYELRGETE